MKIPQKMLHKGRCKICGEKKLDSGYLYFLRNGKKKEKNVTITEVHICPRIEEHIAMNLYEDMWK